MTKQAQGTSGWLLDCPWRIQHTLCAALVNETKSNDTGRTNDPCEQMGNVSSCCSWRGNTNVVTYSYDTLHGKYRPASCFDGRVIVTIATDPLKARESAIFRKLTPVFVVFFPPPPQTSLLRGIFHKIRSVSTTIRPIIVVPSAPKHLPGSFSHETDSCNGPVRRALPSIPSIPFDR